MLVLDYTTLLHNLIVQTNPNVSSDGAFQIDTNIKCFQLCVFMIINAPWYVSNLTLHENLKIPYFREVIFEKYAKHHRKLETHPNPLLHPLLDIGQPRRRKRTQPVDLLWGSRGSVIGRGLIMSHEDCNALLLSAR